MFRCLAAVLLFCILFTESRDACISVLAKPDSSKSSEEEELEQQRKDTLDEIRSLKSDIHSVEQKIRELESAKGSLQAYIQELDQQANAIAAQISDLEEQIEKRKRRSHRRKRN